MSDQTALLDRVRAQLEAIADAETEASLEYFIGLSSRLMKGDDAAQIELLSHLLCLLKADRAALKMRILAESEESTNVGKIDPD